MKKTVLATHRQKFPVLKNVEYFDFIYDGKPVLNIDGKDCEGKNWRDIQKMIGDKRGTQKGHYVFKFRDDPAMHRGVITAIGSGGSESVTDKISLTSVKKSVEDLMNRIDRVNSSNLNDSNITVLKLAYESQIGFYKSQAEKLENERDRLLQRIESLNEKNDDLQNELNESKSDTLLNLIAPHLGKLFGGSAKQPLSDLSQSNPESIPAEILQVIGMVDWIVMTPELYANVLHYLRVYVQQLPLKK